MTMPSSIHEHPEEWLATALADGLSPEERRALDEHLAGCERCRALQTEFTMLDETLLKIFPAAVGPSSGFEARLVAGFRRRHQRGALAVRLRALVGWLLRQRGMQVAGVAAALLALVGIGSQVTRRISRATPAAAIQNDARIVDGAVDQSQIENNMVSQESVATKSFAFKKAESSRSEEGGKRHDGPLKDNSSPEIFLGAVPVGDIDTGRDVTAGFGEVHVPVVGPNTEIAARRGIAVTNGSDLASLHKEQGQLSFGNSTVTLGGANTFTGATTITGGTLAINGTTANNANAHGFDYSARYGATNATDGPNGLAFTGSYALSSDANALRQDAPPLLDGHRNDDSRSERGAASPPPPPAQNSATPAPTPDARKLIRNARAELEVAGFDAAVDAITAAAGRDGGFLDTRNSARGGNGKVTGTLVVKVLPENLDRFLAGLRTLGEVKNQTIQTEDVTKDYFDTDARMRNSRRMEDRLLKMLDEVKGKMSEVLQVEKELARVRADIEQMQGQLRLYDAQVRYATVTLTVYEKDLHQPAAFLLRETATLSLLAADVEKTAAETRRIADAAHAQVARSEVSRDPTGRTHATLRLLVTPESAAEVIAQLKALGRVENFHLQDERTAQNGASADSAGVDSPKVERAPVVLDMTISHDEQVSRQVGFTMVTADVETTFEKARAAATAAGAEIVVSNLVREQDGHATATLDVRVPSAGEPALVTVFKSLGRAGEVERRRAAAGAETGPDAGPALIQLVVVDVEPAVQETTVRVQSNDVERSAAEIKREAAASHVEVEESSFSSQSDEQQLAGLKFRLPMSGYAAFIERVRALGTVKGLTVQRKDRPEKAGGGSDANGPVVVELSLYSEGRVIAENSGLGATLRRTFGQGAGALMWSVQMIGVALALLAPWAVLLSVAAGGIWWLRRRTARSHGEKPADKNPTNP